MKKTSAILILGLFVTSLSIYGQDTVQNKQLSFLLGSYYNIKDALVTGNAGEASANARDFIKTANSIDYKVISEGNINVLLKDATKISDTGDLNIQRQHFANLSANMITIVKAVKMTDDPVYKAYCPMKKASWLTSEMVIKNPYYGKAMLTCGQIEETIKK